jgi:hypothetical protein
LGDTTPQDTAAAAKPPGKLTALAVRVLHNPLQLRVLLMAAAFGGWYAAFSMPMAEGIDDTVRRSERERKRVRLAVEVERLRGQVARFQPRLPEKTDPNEWVQYVLRGVGRFPLRVVMLDTDGTRDVGPYKAVVLKLQVAGDFGDIDAFLRWVEGNPRLLRVDMLKLSPSRGAGGQVLGAEMVVLGVMG